MNDIRTSLIVWQIFRPMSGFPAPNKNRCFTSLSALISLLLNMMVSKLSLCLPQTLINKSSPKWLTFFWNKGHSNVFNPWYLNNESYTPTERRIHAYCFCKIILILSAFSSAINYITLSGPCSDTSQKSFWWLLETIQNFCNTLDFK